jgi:alginate O-acetyltransferase complex protein AlgI
MLFSTMTFLFIFLPIVFIGYNCIPKTQIKVRNIFLLAASCVFYAWGGVYYFLIMLSSITVNYFGGLLVKKENAHRKSFLILTIMLNLLVLFYFKYFNFVLDIFSTITARELNLRQIALPIGISFFTFQALSYVIDVYFERTEPQKNLFNLALYVSLFPQLIAGPIVKYKDIEAQLLNREGTAESAYAGFKRFCFGLAKKVIVANTLAETVDKIFAYQPSEIGGLLAWFAIILYTLQIYYDFSGYSDMAIGLGKVFGFHFAENFNYPYVARSVRDFWRRWHISLSSWFREYVYLPLGGNRKGRARTYINLLIVFMLTGIWHGANLTFLVWGLYFGIFLVAERLFLGALLEKNTRLKILNWLYTILVVIIGWVFFRSPTLSYALRYIGAMLSLSAGSQSFMANVSMKSLIILPFAVLFGGVLQRLYARRSTGALKNSWVFFCTETAAMFALLGLCILILANDAYNPFIYFQF